MRRRIVENGARPGAHCDPRPDRQPVTFRAQQTKQHAVISARAVIQQQRWRRFYIQRDDVHAAIIVDVSKSRAPPRLWGHTREPVGNVLESSVAMIAEQQHRLPVRCSSGDRVDLGVNVAVGDKQVEPAVVIHIKKCRAPAHEGISRPHQSGAYGDVGEIVFAEVVIQS